MHLGATISDQRQVVRPAGLERVVTPVLSALVVSGLAGERPRDHAPNGVVAGEKVACNLTTVIELLERNGFFVRRKLEDGVGGRVDDPLARPLVLLPQFLDDLRT